MDKKRIIYLLNVYQKHQATPEEIAEFVTVLHDKGHETLFNDALDESWDEISAAEIAPLEVAGYDRMLEQIILQPQETRKPVKWWPKIAIAASILAFFVPIYFLAVRQTNTNSELILKNDIAPGKDGATLTLANGKKISVGEMDPGQVLNEPGIRISKTKDGQLIYQLSDDKNAHVGFNTLATSRAEQTQVRLQDGTVIYLNAESSLKYPTSFARAEKRQVELTGEAYFEVAKDKDHPFQVQAANQSVEVLGTTFNISGYADEPTVKTTLLEGSVRIVNQNSNATALLKPGEQAIVREGLLQKRTVEAEDVVAWKKGYFMFDNETLEEVMKKVARWYDLDVRYADANIRYKTFFGSVSRFEQVSEVLKLLQKTGGVTFELKGKEIIVGEKK
ncbi:MAG: DUF4974 domain-containing protein [Pedobacter sp.]|nr:DUF4974 domain-containing protein [Pedobacter sp.]MDQ8052215.1 DUF4974 domain-containing protein [Pedobacter sp.]